MIMWNEWQPSFEYEWLHGKANGSGKKMICNRWVSYDTETSHNHDEENRIGWIYQWCFKIADDVVVGRRPSEFIHCLRKLEEYLTLDKDHELILYAHNASYDLQFLKWYLEEAFGPLEILATAAHKMVYMKCGHFFFKDTWKLCNKSLATWAEDMGTDHKKLVGAIDYEAIHYQDEELTQVDWDYMINDVLAMDEAFIKQMALHQDSLNTVPLTATGYVRRAARRHFREETKNRKIFLTESLYGKQYECCINEFAGGLTHANRHYLGEIVDVNDYSEEYSHIEHRDFVSHFPSQLMCYGVPRGKMNKYMSKGGSIGTVKRLVDEGYCVMCNILLYNVKIKGPDIIMPILSEAKCRAGMLCRTSFVSDNGRVLKMTGACQISVTELDLKWIIEQYNIERYQIKEIYIAKRGKIPKFLRDTILEFMEGKTKFKLLEKAATTKEEREYYHMELMVAKAGLNGIYGCVAQRPVKDEIKMDADGLWHTERKTEEEMEKALEDFYKNRNNIMSYQVACYCTSLARNELLTFCKLIQNNGGIPLYCDTDSIFYLTNGTIEEAIEKRNAELAERSRNLGAFIEYEGKQILFDQFDSEGENIRRFVSLHSKCYSYEELTEKGIELHVTVAGVPAYEDATHKYSRIEELGCMENMKAGFKFTRCGGTTSLYTEDRPRILNINGHITETASACIIERSEKTLHDLYDMYDVFIHIDNDGEGGGDLC